MKNVFTLREVEAFAAMMRYGTVTRAAEALDVSQPAVSRQLADFQRKAGFLVFRRQKQRLVPTQEAQMLFSEVERSFISIQEITCTAREIRDVRAGRLRIGALPGVGLGLLPRIITSFRQQHPNVAITLNVRASQTVIEWAGRNQIDIGVAVTSPIDNPEVVRRRLPPIPAVCAVPKGHVLADRKFVDVRDLEGQEFISLGPSDPLRLQLDRVCAERSIRRQMSIDCHIASAAMAFVANGAGIAVIDAVSAAHGSWTNVAVRPFRPTITVELSTYRQRGVQASRITTTFMDHLVREFGRAVKVLQSPDR
jgi:DNA-binding transcriptional LysR family regulator